VPDADLDIGGLLTAAFMDAHKKITYQKQFDSKRSGTTAVCCLMRGATLCVRRRFLREGLSPLVHAARAAACASSLASLTCGVSDAARWSAVFRSAHHRFSLAR
jgi:hypothetical protein